MNARPLAPIVVAAAVVAGCGGSRPAKHVATACRPAVAAALRTASATNVTATTTAPQFELTGCSYRAGPATVAVTVDTNPQAAERFERAVVETDQNALWSTTPALAPRLVEHLSQGGDWIPAWRQLLATDGRALVTVNVAGAGARAEALAIVAARATLRGRSAR